jgi:eukaryotic-like serine/threonine-protein kinase
MARMTISRDQWQAINPLLAHALELPEDAREAWLGDLDTTQPALSPLLRTLLAADRRLEQGKGFETASVLVGRARPATSGLQPGELVGPYRLLRPLGSGGMGEVWLARQVEGGISRDIALKLPALLGQASFWRERFRRERDILASLQHPNIATLFDAGVAEMPGAAGQPYLAMEYVEGASLLEHAAQRNLSLRDRILVFRQVLAAVGRAHRQLVIHRDLKPSNILVTNDGEAKLLDFGIAKLIEDEATAAADDLTRLGGRLLTFRYAAPEQVHGETLSTATDVYALGVVLHELLTGQSPYRRVRDGSVPGLADFEQQDFALPSSLTSTKGISGDLDAILLKALRRNPADRYGTVEQFDDDLSRYLAHLPVRARRGSRRYRMGRFITRHKLPLVAAAVGALALIAGFAAVEQQRRLAVAAQARAERHFASVRKLANTFIYDIEERLRGLAGTLAVREELARTSVMYLDSLASEAQSDPSLMAELAGGYRRVGEVFAGAGSGNLGNIDAATANLLKAEALFNSLAQQGALSRRNLDDARRVHYTLALLYFAGNDPRWEQQSLQALELGRQLADTAGATAYDGVTAAGQLLEHLKKKQTVTRNPKPDQAMLAEARTRLAATAPQVGNDVRAKGNLAMSYMTMAELLMIPGATDESLQIALDGLQSSANLLQALQRDVPDDVLYAAQGDMVGSTMADVLLQLGRNQEAEDTVSVSIVRSARNVALDPQDVDIMLIHLQALATGTETAYRTGQMALASQRAQQAWRFEASATQDVLARMTESEMNRAKVDYFGGLALLALKPTGFTLACQHLRKVEAYLPRFRKDMPDAAANPATFGQLATALRQCPARGPA